MAKTTTFPIAASANANDLFCINDSGGTKKIRKDNLFTGSSSIIGSLRGGASQLSLNGTGEVPVNLSGFANATGIATALSGNLDLPIGKIKLEVSVKFENTDTTTISLHFGIYDGTTFTEMYITRCRGSAEQNRYKKFIIVLDVLAATTYNIRCFKDNEFSTVTLVDVTDSLIIAEKIA